MKKGVKSIKGKTQVPAGIWTNYNVNEWLPDTPIADRNEAHVKWQLYHQKNGIPELVLEKEVGHFRFNSKGIGEKFLISAHVYTPDLHSASTIEVTVVDNDKPEILGIDLSDVNDQKLSKPAFAGQTINVHVRTVGMVGHHVTISLWEDEKDFTGKPTGSKKIALDIPVRVGYKGIAHCQFVIPQDFTAMFKAMTGQGDQQAEYHVTAYALGLLKATATTPRVDHEVRKKETKEKVEGKTKPKTSVPPVKKNVPVVTPKPTTPAVPSEPQSPAGEQRKITSIYFTDDKGHRITKAGYNSNIRVYIHSQNLIGSNFKLTVLDKDNVTNDILIDAKEYTFTGNATYVDIPLTVEMQEAGGDYFYQNLFVDIVVLATSKHLVSTTINVDLKETKFDPITNTTKFVVEKSEVKKEDGKNKCPNCDKDITVEEIKKICIYEKGKCLIEDLSMITSALPYLHKYRKKVSINTCVRKAHF